MSTVNRSIQNHTINEKRNTLRKYGKEKGDLFIPKAYLMILFFHWVHQTGWTKKEIKPSLPAQEDAALIPQRSQHKDFQTARKESIKEPRL